MLLLVVERYWWCGFIRGGTGGSRITGVSFRKCRLAAVNPKKTEFFYKFKITEITKKTVTIRVSTFWDEYCHTIQLKRFSRGRYFPTSFDSGFRYRFLLI